MEQLDLKWRQRAKETWMLHGDKNSKYFHTCASQRRRKNVISSILDGEGVRHDKPMGIEKAFVEHFNSILTMSSPRGIKECLHLLPVRVTIEMNCKLLGKVSGEEVYQALSQMAHLKALGLDGFLAVFYQDQWSLVGEEVVKAVRGFFRIGIIDPEINFAHIALVLKKNNFVGVSDFRPISLCNVVYKILSKVMANRLKFILPLIISCN